MGYVLKVIRFVLGLSGLVPNARSFMVLVGLCGLISGLATTGMIVIVNRSLTDESPNMSLMAIAFVLCCVSLPFFRFLSQYLLVRLTQRMLYTVRLSWCRRILSLPLRQLESLGPPRLLASLTNDLGAITDALTILPLIFMHSAILTACLVYLGILSWQLLLGLLGFMFFGILTYQLPLLKALVYQRLARQEWDHLFLHIRGVIEGAKELKMHQPRRQAMMVENLEPTAERFRQQVNTATTIFAAASSWGQTLFFVALGLLVFIAPNYQELTPAVIFGYSIVLIHMMTPLEVILTSLPRLTNASVSIDKIDKLGLTLEEEAEEPDVEVLPSGEPDWGQLELRGVTHTFRGEVENESFLLGPIDLTVQAGELIFIVGGNGSGKTTLAKLLLGLYAPEEGEVRFDGEEVTNENRDFYRQHFSAVFSDFFLFDTLLGLKDPHLDSAAEKYLKELQLDHKVKIEAGNFSTIDLSQGQRKRLALLTAYLEDRSIYLFDEWAADQDPFFKQVFYRALLPELKARGKTVLVISHDDGYYDVADRVIKLEAGQLKLDQNREQFQLQSGQGTLNLSQGEAAGASEA